MLHTMLWCGRTCLSLSLRPLRHDGPGHNPSLRNKALINAEGGTRGHPILGLGGCLQGLHQADRQVIWHKALFILARYHADEGGPLQSVQWADLQYAKLRDARHCTPQCSS